LSLVMRERVPMLAGRSRMSPTTTRSMKAARSLPWIPHGARRGVVEMGRNPARQEGATEGANKEPRDDPNPNSNPDPNPNNKPNSNPQHDGFGGRGGAVAPGLMGTMWETSKRPALRRVWRWEGTIPPSAPGGLRAGGTHMPVPCGNPPLSGLTTPASPNPLGDAKWLLPLASVCSAGRMVRRRHTFHLRDETAPHQPQERRGTIKVGSGLKKRRRFPPPTPSKKRHVRFCPRHLADMDIVPHSHGNTT